MSIDFLETSIGGDGRPGLQSGSTGAPQEEREQISGQAALPGHFERRHGAGDAHVQ
jgi:hypothetical protein